MGNLAWLGQIFLTKSISNRVNELNSSAGLNTLLGKHAQGDWGDICLEDKAVNDADIENQEGRVLSAYQFCGVKIWVMTEIKAKVTTVLQPSEY